MDESIVSWPHQEWGEPCIEQQATSQYPNPGCEILSGSLYLPSPSRRRGGRVHLAGSLLHVIFARVF
jgi:hypothetical protein